MHLSIARNPNIWNEIVDKSPYSVLHHRYELCGSYENALPLVIEEGNCTFLFPLRIVNLLKSFRLAVSSIYDFASLLPSNEECFDLIPEALNRVSNFLQEMKVDYLLACAPTFWSRSYTALVHSWFKERGANAQIIYAYLIRTEDKSFEEIWKRQFEKNARKKVHKAKKEGVSVIKIDDVDGISTWIEDLYRCNVSSLKRQGRYGAYPDSYKEVVSSELISDKKRLGTSFNIYGAIYRGHLIAYIIIQEYNKLMQSSKHMSQTRFFSKCPNDAIIAHVVRDACERGFNWFVKGWDRVKWGGKVPSLYSGLQEWRSKFGFEAVPIPIYRLGLTRSGRMIQRLYAGREYIITRGAYIPESIRSLFLRFYAPRRRKMSVLAYA